MPASPRTGWRLDLEIAAEMGVRLATVRKLIAELSAAGDVVMCHLTRYDGGKMIPKPLAWERRGLCLLGVRRCRSAPSVRPDP